MVVSAIRRAAGRVAAVMLIASSSLTAQVAELAPTPKPLAPGVSATLDSAPPASDRLLAAIAMPSTSVWPACTV